MWVFRLCSNLITPWSSPLSLVDRQYLLSLGALYFSAQKQRLTFKRNYQRTDILFCASTKFQREKLIKTGDALWKEVDDDVLESGISEKLVGNVIAEQGGCETTMGRRTGQDERVIEEDLYLEGIGFVTAVLFPDCLTWHLPEVDDELVGNCCWGRRDTEKTVGQVPIPEIYAAEICEMGRPTPPRVCAGDCCLADLPQMSRFAVYTFQRSQYKKCNWVPKSYIFCHESAGMCQAWVERIQGLLDRESHRPKSLLVLVNPYGGKGIGVQEWKSVAPLFERARIRTKVILTERAGHARDLMAKASEEDLKAQDGVVAVGGDGLFNEILNGLLMKRHKAGPARKPQQVAERLAKGSSERKKSANNSMKREDGLSSQVLMNVKKDPLVSSFDVNSPLLDRSVDMSRSTISSSASSSSSSTPERAFGSKGQEQSVNTVQASPVSGQEVELSDMTSIDLSHDGTSPQTDFIGSEGQSLIPTAIQGMKRPSDGPGPEMFSLAAMAPRKKSRNATVQLRIGIIPAGSTDTVAISITGSRDPVTAALHIILGDRMPLDVVRITGWKKSPQFEDEAPAVRFAASFAGYGFYGDVMKESEKTRWMGPARYDIAGAKVFMKHKKYSAEVSFLQVPPNMSTSVRENQRKVVCRAGCFVCSQGQDFNHLVLTDTDCDEDPGLELAKPRWQTRRGSFHSIGAAVMSCRNDKAPDGLSAHAHLADGLLHLILIKKCSRPNYLRQLITMTRKGADPLDFDFVEHYKTPMFTFTSHGEESIWNVDGELFPAHQLSGQCFRGLVNVFARGPEL